MLYGTNHKSHEVQSFKTLGCAMLKDQQSHYDKVYNGKVTKVSPEMQALFDYRSSQEINALATLLGKMCFEFEFL